MILTQHSNTPHSSMFSRTTINMASPSVNAYVNQQKYIDSLKPTAHNLPHISTPPIGRLSKNGSPTTTSSRKSTFTAYEQMRYEAGRPGVYINPKLKGSAEPTRGRPIKRPRLVVFKSEKLKDNTWLEKRRGTWHDYVAEAIASQIIDAENNTPAPPKRKLCEKKRLYSAFSATSSASSFSLSNSSSFPPTSNLHDKNFTPSTKLRSSSPSSSNSSTSSPSLHLNSKKHNFDSKSSSVDSDNESSSSTNSSSQEIDEEISSTQRTPPTTSRDLRNLPQQSILPLKKSHKNKLRRLLPSQSTSPQKREKQPSSPHNRSLRKQQQMQSLKSEIYHQSQFTESPASQTTLQRDDPHQQLNGMNNGNATYDSFYPCAPMPSGSGMDQSKFQHQASYQQNNRSSNSNNNTHFNNHHMNDSNNTHSHQYLSNQAMMSPMPTQSPQMAPYRTTYNTAEESNGPSYNNQPNTHNRPSQRQFVNQMRPNTHAGYMMNENSMANDGSSASMNSDIRLRPPYGSRISKLLTHDSHNIVNDGNSQSISMHPSPTTPVNSAHSSTTQINHPHANVHFIDSNERMPAAHSSDVSRLTYDCHGMSSVRNTATSDVELCGNNVANGMEVQTSSSFSTSNPTTKASNSTKRKQSQSQCDSQQLDVYGPGQVSTMHQSKRELKRRNWYTEPIMCGEPDLDNAAAISFPPDMDRLTCRYQGKAGNLILSTNKQVLEFFTTEQSTSSSDAQLRLAVSWIPQNPFTSVVGSKPMELRIKALHPPNNSLNVHIFEFSPILAATDAANHMRAKIVTGIVACKFRNGQDYNHPVEIKENIQKPYHCETCDKRFKNQNGLEYHVSKAATTCNPNFDPLVGPGKRGRKRRKPLPASEDIGKEDGTQNASNANTTANPRLPGSQSAIEPHPPVNESASASSSSEDSIIRWAMQNATSEIDRARQESRASDSYPQSVPVSKDSNSFKSPTQSSNPGIMEMAQDPSTRKSEVVASLPTPTLYS